MATQGTSALILPHPFPARLSPPHVPKADHIDCSNSFSDQSTELSIARITFKALNCDAPLPERTLTLHPHLRTIQIGRASKSPSKGLQAALNNAWFDSPVMSRNHAEISLDTESNVITIQDIGSMHGTFVNDLQLRRGEPSGLSSGDLVVFGAEVKRNLDTFPACAFRVNYEFLPFKYVQNQPKLPVIHKSKLTHPSRASNSYTFPESDDEDYEMSDDDMEGNEEPSSEDGVSIESPPHKASQAIQSIDLTRDDSPAASSIAEVDSNSQTRVDKEPMNIMAGQPADINNHADPVSVTIYTGNPPILVDSEDEDAHFSSDSDDQSDGVEYDDGASEGNSVGEQEDYGNEDDNDDEMDREERVTSELRDFPHKELEQASGLVNQGLYSLLDAPLPESNVRSIADASDNIIEEDGYDDESDFGLSDAGAEGIRALFDDGLIDNEGDSYLEEDMDDESDTDSVIIYDAPPKASMAEKKIETPKHVTFASLPAEQHPEIASSCGHFDSYTLGNLDVPSHPTISGRQPSPSDAAMVKTATPSTFANHTANPVRVHHLPSQEFQNLTAQSLGDKTGKHAFFAAREDNKAKVYAGENGQSAPTAWIQQPETVISPTAEEKRQRSMLAMGRFRERKRRMEEEAKAKMSESVKVVLPMPSSTSTATNFCKSSAAEGSTTVLISPAIAPLPSLSYLDDHTQAPKAIRTPSPEPDMTSAVMYNESKASMANKNTSGRSGLRIHDIIEGGEEHTSNNLKRKADNISEAIENEVRVWASSSPALEASAGLFAPTLEAATHEEQSKTAPIADVAEQRPSKMRKLVESVGYVALGGATLFGALVLSAPDFL